MEPYRPDSHSKVHWDSPRVRIGTFRVGIEDPDFSHAGQMSRPTVVFPRRTVRIAIEGDDPFIADAATTVFYNAGRPYRREWLTSEGDLSDFFHFGSELIEESLWEIAGKRVKDPQKPFDWSHSLSDSKTYALQRLVVHHASSSSAPDSLFVEESAIEILVKTLKLTNGGGVKDARSSSRTRSVVEAVRQVLSLRFEEDLSLHDLAAEVGCSGFHLSRLFRAETGATLHQYRQRLRLNASLERVAKGDDLATVAADLGYASHSHFTSKFHAAYGVTPSEFRQMAIPTSVALPIGRTRV